MYFLFMERVTTIERLTSSLNIWWINIFSSLAIRCREYIKLQLLYELENTPHVAAEIMKKIFEMKLRDIDICG